MILNANGYPIIGDDFRFDANLDGGEFGTGYVPRDMADFPLNSEGFCAPRALPTFTMSEIVERAREKTAKKTWIKDRCDRVGSKVKNQSRSNYCWNHAVVRGGECDYVLQGGKVFTLSAFWGAARLKNGRNQGGWGLQAAKYMHDVGVPVESLHKPMDFSVDRSPETEANAKLHQLREWEDIEPSDMLAIYTRIVLDMPVTVGIPAWGHEVLLTFLEVTGDNSIDPGFDNSWSTSWGNNGRGVLQGRMKRFSEAGSIVSMEPASE